MREATPDKVFVRFGGDPASAENTVSTAELLASQQTLELCGAVVYMEDQVARMKVRVEHITGLPYDEFIDGMRQLLAPDNDTGGKQ
jgi:hypothetical protein